MSPDATPRPGSGDVPLLDRLANLPAVPVARLVELLEHPEIARRDAILAGMVAETEEGEAAVHPLVASILEHLGQRADAACYPALIEALTGIWNAAVRSAAVGRLRATGLPPDDLLLRLESLSPTLGLQRERRDWARAWMADPTAQDAGLVQQCLVRLLLAMRGLAEARADALLAGPPDPPLAQP